MKKILLILIVILIAAAVLFPFGDGFGFGAGSGSGRSVRNGIIPQEAVRTVQSETTGETTAAPTETIYQGQLVKVTVSESDYFFRNERITLDKLMETLLNLDGSFIVEIIDDNASLRAYNDLIHRLEDSRISYVEQPVS